MKVSCDIVIGFDDAKIYDEMEKHHLLREMPSQIVSIPEAREVFVKWVNSEHKIEY